MPPTSVAPLKKQCPYCQAGNHPDAAQCWLCYAPLRKADGGIAFIPQPPPPPVTDSPHHRFFEIYFAVLFFLALAAMAVVAVGAFLTDPSLGMISLVAIAPVVLVSGITMAIRYSSTGKVDYLRGVLAMAFTALVAVGIAAALVVVGIVLLFVACLQMMGP
ncbi:MAG TPA: zinc ribbon domain-containing protein [Pirellulaceae bacterium]|jgi:hypothetical protein|nr:zinc ribbon domain-containing protein [Pirellulaceae bacterium]